MKKKGISPIVATILMIAVAVALAVVIYAWASGFMTATTERTTLSSPMAYWLVNESSFDNSGNFIIYIRLLGDRITSPQSSFDVYVNGNIYLNWTISPVTPGDNEWTAPEVWYFTINGATRGNTIKVIHKLTGYYVTVIAP